MVGLEVASGKDPMELIHFAAGRLSFAIRQQGGLRKMRTVLSRAARCYAPSQVGCDVSF
jgi:hypothetical protein